MKHTFLIILATLMLALPAVARTDEVLVTRQLTMAQRKSLPAKTIELEMKRLAVARNADVDMVDALMALLDTLAARDVSNRTFVLIIQPRDNDINIAVHSDDIVTKAEHRTAAYGDIQRGRCHFVVLADKNNERLLQRNFKRQDKVKFVQDFVFVNFPTPVTPTSVLARWSAQGGMVVNSCVIDEGAEPEDIQDQPALMQDVIDKL